MRGDGPEIISMRDVWASYDSKNYILRRMSLSVRQGSNFAIVGESGSGKSTILKLLDGLVVPSRGTIKIKEQTPSLRSRQFRHLMTRIGYIPQQLGLVRNLTVLENVLIGALPRVNGLRSLFGSFPEEEIEGAHDLIKKVGLGGKDGRRVYMLSGGEKRRVAIARALMQKPEILLADEIVSELDGKTSRDIMEIVAAEQKRGLTAVMIHHDTDLALRYADRVALIRGEKILEMGVKGDLITDLQTGMTQEELLEMDS